MSQLSLRLPSTLHAQSQRGTRMSCVQTRTDYAQRMGITSREPATVRGTAKRPHFSLAFISVTVQLWTQVFWVISVYFNIRNTPEVLSIPPGTPCILIIFYISSALLHVSMHLHHLQRTLTLCFAKVTKLFKLQLTKIGTLKCSRDRC